MSIGERFGSTVCHRVTYEGSLYSSNHSLATVVAFCRHLHLLNAADQNEFFFIHGAFKKFEF